MIKKLAQYCAALWRQAFHTYATFDTVIAIVVAVAAGAYSLVAPLYGLSEPPKLAVWVAALWVVFLYFVVAPFRLWIAQRQQIEQLQAQVVSGLRLSLDEGSYVWETESEEDVQPYPTLRLRIENVAPHEVLGCQIHLYVGHDSKYPLVVSRPFKLLREQRVYKKIFEWDLDLEGHGLRDVRIPLYYREEGGDDSSWKERSDGVALAIESAAHDVLVEVLASNTPKATIRLQAKVADGDWRFTAVG